MALSNQLKDECMSVAGLENMAYNDATAALKALTGKFPILKKYLGK